MTWDKPVWLADVPLTSQQQASVERLLHFHPPRLNGGYTCARFGSGNWWRLPRGKYNLHRVVAEVILGERLPRRVEVHHLNGKEWDNHPCNLVVCTHAWHKWLHSNPENLFRRRQPGEAQRRVLCGCGCGKRRWLFDRTGMARLYLWGHAAAQSQRGAAWVPPSARKPPGSAAGA